MDQANMKRLHQEAALWVWADRCGEAGEPELPRLILDCCQASYDLAFGNFPPVTTKRAVFEAVAAGRLDAAVKAMEGDGLRVELEDEGARGVRARIEQPELGIAATASGRHPLGAELRGLMELVLLSAPEKRTRVLG